MDNENFDTDYLKEALRLGVKDIFEAQRKIYLKNIYQKGHDRTEEKRSGRTIGSRSGALRRALDNPNAMFGGSAATSSVNIEYPLHIRFLDMKRLGNWKIYNKQIWGILYKETFLRVRYGVSDWLREFIDKNLRNSLQL